MQNRSGPSKTVEMYGVGLFAFIIFLSTMLGLPVLPELSVELGASETVTFRRITLPLILPGILGGALLAFTVSFDNFLITYMLAGPGITTIPIQVYSMVRFEITPKIHAFSTFIVLISMTLIIINERVIRGRRE